MSNHLERINDGKRIILPLVFEDGSVLSTNNTELVATLGLQTHARLPNAVASNP